MDECERRTLVSAACALYLSLLAEGMSDAKKDFVAALGAELGKESNGVKLSPATIELIKWATWLMS